MQNRYWNIYSVFNNTYKKTSNKTKTHITIITNVKFYYYIKVHRELWITDFIVFFNSICYNLMQYNVHKNITSYLFLNIYGFLKINHMKIIEILLKVIKF